MAELKLKPGDLFGSTNPMALGRGINAVQWFYSTDGEAKYSHSGMIISEEGDTYEARWFIREYHLRDYVGKPVIIARYKTLSVKEFARALLRIKIRHHNQFYPVWRIPLHVLGPMAKWLSWKGEFVVCSELVAELEYFLGLRHYQYMGATPDRLADEWRWWQGWKIKGEGILKMEDGRFLMEGIVG